MRCPECARDRTSVRSVRSLPSAPSVTMTLIAINVIVFIAEILTGGQGLNGVSGVVVNKGDLFGPAIVHQHQYWRLVTSGFLHDGLLHIAFNMFFLWIVGPQLETAIGSLNFAVVYFVSLLAGSFGALLFEPNVPTLGASGAVFG